MDADMRRRDFLGVLGCAAVTVPLGVQVQAQEAGRKYRIAALVPQPRDSPSYVALFGEIQKFGFVEGKNLTIDSRSYGQQIELLARYADELFATPADVILAAGDLAIRAAQQATKTIPILALTDDLLAAGFVASLAKPGGNTTGVSLMASDLDGKRQEILIEAVPGLRRMAVLADTNTTPPRQLQALEDAARARGLELAIQRVSKSGEIASALAAVQSSGAGALNVLASPLLFASRDMIIERAAAMRMPAIYQWPEMAEEGGFIGYGPRIVQLYREMMSRQLVQLLRGTKPSDLPVEQPTKFEFLINMKTANALGLPVSRSMQLLADRVIE